MRIFQFRFQQGKLFQPLHFCFPNIVQSFGFQLMKLWNKKDRRLLFGSLLVVEACCLFVRRQTCSQKNFFFFFNRKNLFFKQETFGIDERSQSEFFGLNS